MDISNINTAPVQNEPPRSQVADVNETEVKSFAKETEIIKEKAVSMSKEEALAVAESLETYMDILKTTLRW